MCAFIAPAIYAEQILSPSVSVARGTVIMLTCTGANQDGCLRARFTFMFENANPDRKHIVSIEYAWPSTANRSTLQAVQSI